MLNVVSVCKCTKKVAYKCMTSRLRCTRNAAPFRSIYRFNANCLHSALFVCTALIFKRFRRVDNSEIYLHAVCTQLHSCLHCLHLFALVCTIYVACTYQHKYKCTRVVPTTHYGIGGACFRLLRQKNRPPYAATSGWHDRFVYALDLPYRLLVQTSAYRRVDDFYLCLHCVI